MTPMKGLTPIWSLEGFYRYFFVGKQLSQSSLYSALRFIPGDGLPYSRGNDLSLPCKPLNELIL